MRYRPNWCPPASTPLHQVGTERAALREGDVLVVLDLERLGRCAGERPTSTLHHYLAADGTLRDPGQRLLGA